NRQNNGENFFPETFLGHCWKAESVAEFRCEEVAGSRAIGVTNFNDTLSSQGLVYVENAAPLTPGKEYRLRGEYRTANDGVGKVFAREPGPSYRSVGEAALVNGGSGWKVAEATFKRPEGKTVELCFENSAVGEGNTVWVRKIEIAEVK